MNMNKNYMKNIVIYFLVTFFYSAVVHAQCPGPGVACNGMYPNIVISEVSGDSGQSDGCNDGIVEISGPVGADIGCMVVSNSEWAVVLPTGATIGADGTYLIACSYDINNNCGVGINGSANGIACDECDFPGLDGAVDAATGPPADGSVTNGEIDLDVCDPDAAAYYDPAATGFTIDNSGDTDGDQVVLFQPDGTVHDAVKWATGATGGADNCTTQTGPYTLGDNDGNGTINDDASAILGGRCDGQNSTAVPIMPDGDCNASANCYTMPALSDPVYLDAGDNAKGCNSSYIRGGTDGGIDGSPSHSDGFSADGTAVTETFTPDTYLPSSCPGSTAWGYTDHPTPGQANDDITWEILINGANVAQDIELVQCMPGAVNIEMIVYNYQHVSTGNDSGVDGAQTGSIINDPINGIDLPWTSVVVSGEMTTLTYSTTLQPGTFVYDIVWDDYSNCCGTSGNPGTQSNPNECYETSSIIFTVSEPLQYDCDGDGVADAVQTPCAISCDPGPPDPGAINVADYITGGLNNTYTLSDDAGILADQVNTTGVFILPTDAVAGPYTVTIDDGAIDPDTGLPCSPSLTITVADNCEEPPICPEDFVTTIDGGAGPVVACPGQVVNLCFDGRQLPSGGTVTWQFTNDGGTSFTDIEVFPIPAPVGCAATAAVDVTTGLTPFAGGANAGWELDAAGNWVSVVDYTGIGTTSGNGTGVHFTQLIYDPATLPTDGVSTCGDGTSWSSTGAEIVEISGPPGTDIGCYIFSDGEGVIVIPAGTLIPADGVYVIGSACALGAYPVGEIDLVVTPELLQGTMIFSNAGDQVILLDASGNLADGLVYEGADTFDTVPATTAVEGMGGYNSVPADMTFCTSFTIPDDSCPAGTFDFQAVVSPFDGANCPVDGPDEADGIATGLQATVACPDAVLVPAVFDVCEVDMPTVNIPVTITGGTGPYTLVYNDGTTDVTLPTFAAADMIPITGPTMGEIKISLVSITDEGGAFCAGSVNNDEICVNIRPSEDLTITGSTQPATCMPCDGTITFDISGGGISMNLFDLDYTIDGVLFSLASVSMPYTLTGVCPGSYDIVGATDEAGCAATVTSSEQVLVAPIGAPISVTAQPAAICGNGDFSLDLTTAVTYSIPYSAADFQFFTVDPNTLPASALTATPPLVTGGSIASVTAAATYYVLYTDPVTGCESITTVDVTIDNSICPACNISAAVVAETACDNGTTIDDTSDDTFTFTISDVVQDDGLNFTTGFTIDASALGLGTITGDYTGGLQYTSPAINIDTYFAGSPYTLTVADQDLGTCTFDIMVTVPANCSPCNDINVTAAAVCTGSTADDEYFIEVTSVTGGDATAGTFTVSDGVNPDQTYSGATLTFGPYTHSGTGVAETTFTVTDDDTNICTTTIDVIETLCAPTGLTCDCLDAPNSGQYFTQGTPITGNTLVYVLVDDVNGSVTVNNTGLFTGLIDSDYTAYTFDVLDADEALFTAALTDATQVTNAVGGIAPFDVFTFTSASAPFTVDCIPEVPVITPPADFCENIPNGTSGMFTVTNATSAVTWTEIANPGATTSTSGANGENLQIATPATAGTYTFEVCFTSAAGCDECTQASVEVLPIPTVALSLPAGFCANAGAQTGLSGGTPAQGTELGDVGVYSGIGVTDNADGTFDFDPAINGTGIVTVTYTYTDANGCSNMAQDNLEVFPVPVVNFTALADLCISDGVQAGLSGGSADLIGTGVYSGTGVTDNADGTYDFDPATAGAGVHTITYTFTSDNGCIDSATDDVTVNALPVVSFADLSDFCIDGGVQTGLSGGAPAAGTLLGDMGVYSGTGVTDNADGTFDFDPSIGAGTYQVTYTYTDPIGCFASAQSSITVFELPIVTISPVDPSACEGSSALTLSSITSGGAGGYTYLWTGDTAPLSSTTAASVAVNTLTAGVYNLTLTVTDAAGCIGSDNVTVTVVANPAPTIAAAGPFCEDDPTFALTVSPDPAVAGGTGVLSGPGVDATNYTFDPIAAGPGLHQVSYLYTSPEGCIGLTQIDVQVNELPDVEAGNDVEICANGVIDLTALGANIAGATEGVWTTSGDGTFDNTAFTTGTIYTPGATDITNGTITLTLSSTVNDAGFCGAGSDSMQVTFRNINCGNFPWGGN